MNKTEQVKERRWLGEREEVWGGGQVGLLPAPQRPGWVLLRAEDRLQQPCRSWPLVEGAMGTLGPSCHPQVALPLAAPREEPQAAPTPHTGSLGAGFHFQAQDPAHRMDK